MQINSLVGNLDLHIWLAYASMILLAVALICTRALQLFHASAAMTLAAHVPFFQEIYSHFSAAQERQAHAAQNLPRCAGLRFP